MSAAAPSHSSWLPRAVPLVAAAGLVGTFFAFRLHHTLTLESLQSHRDDLVRVRDRNPVLFGKGYLLAYILMAALAIPGAFVMTVAGGAVFGLVEGTVLASFGPSLGWFDLAFRPGGPPLMPLNAYGANLHSAWLGMPFGDQGFVIPARSSAALGGFEENAPYGEDHLLAGAARRAGIALRRIGACLFKSARKYERGGWAATTARHLWLTAALLRDAALTVRNGGPPYAMGPATDGGFWLFAAGLRCRRTCALGRLFPGGHRGQAGGGARAVRFDQPASRSRRHRRGFGPARIGFGPGLPARPLAGAGPPRRLAANHAPGARLP